MAPAGTPVPLLGHVYFATMGVGLAIALIVIGVTLPLLNRTPLMGGLLSRNPGATRSTAPGRT
jgi:hypothetical protein